MPAAGANSPAGSPLRYQEQVCFRERRPDWKTNLYPFSVIEDTLMLGGNLLVGSLLEMAPSPWKRIADGPPDLTSPLFATIDEEENGEEDEDDEDDDDDDEDDEDEDDEDLDDDFEDLDEEDLSEDLDEEDDEDEDDDEDDDDDEDEDVEEPAGD
jgi:hypothetical protein